MICRRQFLASNELYSEGFWLSYTINGRFSSLSLMLRVEKFNLMMLMSSFISLVFCSSKRFFLALKNTWPAKYRHPVNKVTFCVPFRVRIDRVWLYREVSIGNSMISGIFGINTTSDISKFLYVMASEICDNFEYHEWYLCQISHTNHMLLFVYTNTCKGFVIFTCRYFNFRWNTTALSQSNCRNFSCSGIKVGTHDTRQVTL